MKRKSLRAKIRTTPKACKGKKGGCYWEGEPEGIVKVTIKNKLRLAA